MFLCLSKHIANKAILRPSYLLSSSNSPRHTSNKIYTTSRTNRWIEGVSAEQNQRLEVRHLPDGGRESGRPSDRLLHPRLDIVYVVEVEDCDERVRYTGGDSSGAGGILRVIHRLIGGGQCH